MTQAMANNTQPIIQAVANHSSRGSASSLLSQRRDKTSSRQQTPTPHNTAAAACRTTSRTCSNELLNVISIDDDRLRYRHFTQAQMQNG